LIFYRSNWKWFCKQVLRLDRPLATLKWMFNKKQQLFLIQVDGRIDFVEFNLTYHTSSGNFNHFGHHDLSYTAVVDNAHINLTPLGRLLMPPPMSEKQVPVEDVCQAVWMYGHTFIGIAGDQLVALDAEKVEAKRLESRVMIDLTQY
jgi:hypothetical protein